MNWDRIEGNWKQVTGRVKEQWGKLTDDDMEVAAGSAKSLSGRSKRGTASLAKTPSVRFPIGSEICKPSL